MPQGFMSPPDDLLENSDVRFFDEDYLVSLLLGSGGFGVRAAEGGDRKRSAAVQTPP